MSLDTVMVSSLFLCNFEYALRTQIGTVLLSMSSDPVLSATTETIMSTIPTGEDRRASSMTAIMPDISYF